MCGIAGYIRFDSNSIDPGIIDKMVDSLRHRGPVSNGKYVNGRAAFGHTRLPIIDLSESGHQPFHDPSGRYTLVFNGTVYNYRELRKQLTCYSFKTESDTEVLLAAYMCWGAECLAKLDGIFAFVVWDNVENKLFIARDKFGVKPFYYVLTDDYFVFASELRAIIASGLSSRKVNRQAIYSYLKHQSVPSESNIIKGVVELQAGHFGFLLDGQLTTIQYHHLFTKPHHNGENLSLPYYKNKVRELFSKAVRKRMVGDVPIGVFLSGGIDSSVLVAALSEMPGANINTFTVLNKSESPNEHIAAASVAKLFKTNHLEIALEDDDIITLIEKALSVMDSPSGDGINTYLISKVANDAGFRIALSGIGGDELFMGYPFFRVMSRIKKYEQLWKQTSAVRNSVSRLPIFEGTLASRKLKSLLKSESATLKEIYPVFRNIWDDRRLEKLLSPQMLTSPFVQGKLDFDNEVLGTYPFISQITMLEYLGYSQHTLLKDTDQMGMAVSLEIREPFFDHELVSLVLNIPDKIKHSNFPKELLFNSFADILPPSILQQKKTGFTFPWHKWMRRELRVFCSQHIKRLAERELINDKYIIDCWTDFVKGGNRFNWMEIWVLVVLEYWLEKNGINE